MTQYSSKTVVGGRNEGNAVWNLDDVMEFAFMINTIHSFFFLILLKLFIKFILIR